MQFSIIYFNETYMYTKDNYSCILVLSSHSSPFIPVVTRCHLTDFDLCPLVCSAGLTRLLIDLLARKPMKWALPGIEIPFSWMVNT